MKTAALTLALVAFGAVSAMACPMGGHSMPKQSTTAELPPLLPTQPTTGS